MSQLALELTTEAIEKEPVDLEEVEMIIQDLQKAYAAPTDKRPWVVASSFGKDSSTLATLIWKAVERTPLEYRTRKVYFMTSDTGIEPPPMRAYMERNVQLINQTAKKKGLDVITATINRPNPKLRFGPKFLGMGLALPIARNPHRCMDSFTSFLKR